MIDFPIDPCPATDSILQWNSLIITNPTKHLFASGKQTEMVCLPFQYEKNTDMLSDIFQDREQAIEWMQKRALLQPVQLCPNVRSK